jgi:thiol-disulfide isomerase/thioredoxin
MTNQMIDGRRFVSGRGWCCAASAVVFALLAGMAVGQTKESAATGGKGEKPATKKPAKANDAPEVDVLIDAFEGSDDQAFSKAYQALENKLASGDPASKAIARKFLGRRRKITTEAEVAALLDAAAKNDLASAAQLLLQIARARRTVRTFKRGHVVIGQVIVVDHKTDAELILAQMPIAKGGYFAGEVGDLTRPICFRAQGYQGVDVPLEGKKGDVVSVGEVRMKPLAKAEQAVLRGSVQMDVEGQPTDAKVRVNLEVGPPNTPHNGFSPRRRWPAPVTVAVKENGEFVAEGLSPGDYYVQISAEKHVDATRRVSLKPSEPLDLGTCRLFSTDIGKYVGKPAPSSSPLAWEKDFATAAERARLEKKPLLVMMTATWCGPCKMLEEQTLSDAWVRQFLGQFVVVKAYEDKEVEGKYGLNGYPTLVFADSDGKAAYKSVGFKTTLPFCAECAQAIDALKLTMPPELETLIDMKVVDFKRRL